MKYLRVKVVGPVVSQGSDHYHLEEQYRSWKVGVLLKVPDDCRLNDFSATFYNQTGRGHCGQLVGLHVS